MPMPPVDPIPLPDSEFFAGAPLDAQEASYFAASARISSFLKSSIDTEYIYSINNIYFILFIIPIFHLFFYQLKIFNSKNSESCLRAFKSNNFLGFLVFLNLLINKII